MLPARGAARFHGREGNKTDEAMRYDMFALFFEHAEDSEPRYKVPMGIYHEIRIGELEGKGFLQDPEATEGYLDYIKETYPDELQEYTQEGYVSELMDVLYSGEDFERIAIQMMELEAIDDEGTIPPWGTMVNKTFIRFQFTEPYSPVVFIDGDPYEATENTRTFQVPLKRLKDYFEVLTAVEVIEKLNPEGGMDWEWEDFKHFFESSEVDAVDLLIHTWGHDIALETKEPYILHLLEMGLKGTTREERVAGFLYNTVFSEKLSLDELTKYGFSKEVTGAMKIIIDCADNTFDHVINTVCGSGNALACKLLLWDLEWMTKQASKTGEQDEARKYKGHLDKLCQRITDMGIITKKD